MENGKWKMENSWLFEKFSIINSINLIFHFPFSINLVKIRLLDNTALGIGNGLHDDEGIRVKLLDGGFDAADFEARNDAV